MVHHSSCPTKDNGVKRHLAAANIMANTLGHTDILSAPTSGLVHCKKVSLYHDGFRVTHHILNPFWVPKNSFSWFTKQSTAYLVRLMVNAKIKKGVSKVGSKRRRPFAFTLEVLAWKNDRNIVDVPKVAWK